MLAALRKGNLLGYADYSLSLGAALARVSIIEALDAQMRAAFAARDRAASAAVRAGLDGPPSETGPQKSARLRRLRRVLEDNSLVGRMASMINDGLSTDEARARLKIGAVRAQRVRALAVQFGMLKPRQR